MNKIALLLMAVILLSPASGFAQQNGQADKQAPASETMREKLELARKMHEIRPAREQIDAAIDEVSNMLPESDRDTFRIAARRMIDYEALERKSIETMAEIFTREELQAMVAFYRNPATRHISDKLKTYNEQMKPEVYRMLDAAMMEIRTGGTGE